LTAGAEAESCMGFQSSLKPAAGSIPDVMFVVDRSYSMVNSEDRWSPALNAIAQVTQSLEEGVAFGLTLFPDPLSASGEPSELSQCISWGRNPYSCEEDVAACAPGRVMHAPALNSAMVIQELLMTHRPLPDLATPTYSALQAAATALGERSAGSNKVIILITDGMPGCNFMLEPTSCDCLTSAPFFCEFEGFAAMCLDDQRTSDEVQRIAGLGIQTVVVGMTIGLPPEGACMPSGGCAYGGQRCESGRCVNLASGLLSELARLGGDPTGDYYSVEQLNELSAQITRAAAGFAPCLFDLPNVPEAYYDQLALYIDGEQVPSDPNRMNGWWAEAGRLELFGEACASIRDGQSHQVSARCE